jgi:hypothetical protein
MSDPFSEVINSNIDSKSRSKSSDIRLKEDSKDKSSKSKDNKSSKNKDDKSSKSKDDKHKDDKHKDHKPKKDKNNNSQTVIDANFIKTVNQTLLDKTSNYLIPVGVIRRGLDEDIIPTELEYLTTKPMNLIATALMLPNSINLKPDLEKISYKYQDELTITIRLATSDTIINQTFWYTNTKTYNNKLVKLLKNHKFILTSNSLVNETNGEKVISSSEVALCKNISTIIGVKVDPQQTKRTADYAEIIETNYKIAHKDNISKMSKSFTRSKVKNDD